MKPPNPPSGRREGGGGDGRVYPVIHLSYMCFGETLGRGRWVGPGKVYPIILSVFVGSDRTDFSKTRVLDRTRFLPYKCGWAMLGVYPI